MMMVTLVTETMTKYLYPRLLWLLFLSSDKKWKDVVS